LFPRLDNLQIVIVDYYRFPKPRGFVVRGGEHPPTVRAKDRALSGKLWSLSKATPIGLATRIYASSDKTTRLWEVCNHSKPNFSDWARGTHAAVYAALVTRSDG
jgi:hypothetical protein